MAHRLSLLPSLLSLALVFAISAGCGSKWTIEDNDGDGASSETDCWDNPDGPAGSGLSGADIFPGAEETWYDGIDQDCGGDDDFDADQDGFVPEEFNGEKTLGVATSGALPSGDCWDDPASIPDGYVAVPTKFRDREGTPLSWVQPDPGEVFPGAVDIWYDGVDQDCSGNDDFDQDLDGYRASAYPDVTGAFGPDCNDGAPIDEPSVSGKPPETINPDATEVWYDGTDDNCDGNDCDQDGDGYQRDGATRYDSPMGYCPTEECDDSDPGIFPDLGVVEVWYNGNDENCDGNDGDRDGDGYWVHDYVERVKASGSGQDPYVPPKGFENDCWDDWESGEIIPTEYSVVSSKLTDKNGAPLSWDQLPANEVYPGATDLFYDNVDANCEGDDDHDQDRDGYRTDWYPDRGGVYGLDCYDATEVDSATDSGVSSPKDPAAIYPAALEVWYDGTDDDCDRNDCDQDHDGYCLENYEDSFSEYIGTWGFLTGDCLDTGSDRGIAAVTINPAATETPDNRVDQDCDDQELCYDDTDNDNHVEVGSPTHNSTSLSCANSGDGLSTEPADDCNDSVATIYTGAPEVVADGIDQDCSIGDTCYRDLDLDTFGTSVTVVSADLDCVDSGESRYATDCLDSGTNAVYAYPGAAPYDSATACMMDYDGDDHGSTTAPGTGTAGDDCNDSVPSIYAGATEVVADGIDQDCSTGDTCYQDLDGDRYGSTTTVVSADLDCADSGESTLSTDCLDTNNFAFPGAAELEAVTTYCREDADADGYGDASPPSGVTAGTDCLDSGTNAAYAFPGAAPNDSATACMMDYDGDNHGSTTAPGSGTAGDDCDDSVATVYTGATEVVADSVDQDCSGGDTCYRDNDGDRYGTSTTVVSTDLDCVDTNESSYATDCLDSGTNAAYAFPGAAPSDSTTACMMDYDGDDHGSTTAPGTGTAGDDCNDSVATIYAGAAEVVTDGIDQDCSGGDTCYRDNDGDNYGTSTTTVSADLDCIDSGESSYNTDCLDSGTNAAYAFPGAAPSDSATACMMDYDGDNHGSTTAPGTGTAGDDCNDSVATIYAGATEVTADGVDQDCSGGDTCYRDNDGDTYGTSTTTVSTDLDCTDTGESRYSTDCLDSGTNAAYAFPGAAPSDSTTACMMDYDGDNHGSTTAPGTGTAGDDCNDSVATIYAGATEVVADGVDQDCSTGDTCYRDNDGDLYGTSTTIVSADLDCTDSTESLYSTDCLDSNANAFPGAAERESSTSCREDADADGYGDLTPPSGVTAGTDCNDASASIYPTATEVVADGIDQDCSTGDTCYRDSDGDTWGTSTTTVSADLDCTDTGESRYSTDCLDSGTNAAYAFPGAASIESSTACMMDYDGDNYGSTTAPGTGTAGTDCDDTTSGRYPGLTEVVADGIDQDCASGDTCYRDNDGDSYGTSTTIVSADLDCTDATESRYSTDCLDSNAYAFPGAAESESATSCREDADSDGYGDISPPSGVTAGTDCDDSTSGRRPGLTEIVADGIDQDCVSGDTCYSDADGDSFGTTTTRVSSDLDCSDANESTVTTDCLDSGTNAVYAFPGAAPYDSASACMMDADGDNYGSTTAPGTGTAGTDCDDTTSGRYPGLAEIVADGIDQDCASGDTCYRDNDLDTYGTSTTIVSADLDCTDATESRYSTDCLDTNISAFPGAAESESTSSCMEDADSDGYGDISPPSGVTAGTDCDDSTSGRRPGLTEVVADGIDQDCVSGDTCYRDLDGDTYGTSTTTVSADLNCTDTGESRYSTDCLDSGTNAAYAFPGAASIESASACMMDYDGDNYGSTTAPGTGTAGTDCDDSTTGRRPGLAEVVADGIDQDCVSGDTCYRDLDGDTYGTSTTTVSSDLDCTDTGESRYSTDCLDSGTNAAYAFPGAASIESASACMMDYDGDNYGSTTAPGTGTAGTDCDDSTTGRRPGLAEIVADGIDQDCVSGDTCYRDLDGDTYGTSTTTVSSDLDCTDTGESLYSTDCLDSGTNAAYAFPGAAPSDSALACMMDADGDDYGSETAPGTGTAGTDCADSDGAINPGETDDDSDPLVDNDCDGYIDEESIMAGSLVITEISQDSTAGGIAATRNPEANWIEIYNPGLVDIDLSNWVIATCGESCTTVYEVAISPAAGIIVPSEGYVVLCQDDTVFDTLSDCDYDYGGGWVGSNPDSIPYSLDMLGFDELEGTIDLSLEATAVDDVAWTIGWPDLLTSTMCVMDSFEDSVDNDDSANWSNDITTVWATDPEDNYGTPGAANLTCDL